MTKRREPWDEYPAVHRRLQQWSDWVHSRYDALGWNVYQGDQEPRLKVQLRNDLHGDKVFQEVANLDADTRRALETDNAYRTLSRQRRCMIWILYVNGAAYPKQAIAHSLDMDHRRVSDELEKAFIRLDGVLAGIRMARASAA